RGRRGPSLALPLLAYARFSALAPVLRRRLGRHRPRGAPGASRFADGAGRRWRFRSSLTHVSVRSLRCSDAALAGTPPAALPGRRVSRTARAVVGDSAPRLRTFQCARSGAQTPPWPAPPPRRSRGVAFRGRRGPSLAIPLLAYARFSALAPVLRRRLGRHPPRGAPGAS